MMNIFRANPPGGFTSNAFDFQYDGEKKILTKSSANASLNNDRNDNVIGYETKALDNANRVQSRACKQITEGGGKIAEPFGFSRHQQSRFAAALDQPALDVTTSERMRTPR